MLLLIISKPISTKDIQVKVSIIFVLDQVLHLAIICGLSNMNTEFCQVSFHNFLKTVLFVLLVGKPTNIALEFYLVNFNLKRVRVGYDRWSRAMIGFLELFGYRACLLYGQFASIIWFSVYS